MPTYVLRNGELVDKSTLPYEEKPRTPYVIGDYAAYECPIKPGTMIDGRVAHRENLKKHGMRVKEPSETVAGRRKRGLPPIATPSSDF